MRFLLPANIKQSSETSRGTVLSQLCLVVAAGEKPAARRAAPNLCPSAAASVRGLQADLLRTLRHEQTIACQPNAASAHSHPAASAAHAASACHAGAQKAAGRAIRQRNRLPTHVLPPCEQPVRGGSGSGASEGRCRTRRATEAARRVPLPTARHNETAPYWAVKQPQQADHACQGA